MNIGKRFGTPRAGESAQAFKKREQHFKKALRELLGSPTGREVLAELIASSHPLQPRTHPSLSAEQSAFLDGEMSFLGWLVIVSEQTDLLKIQPQALAK